MLGVQDTVDLLGELLERTKAGAPRAARSRQPRSRDAPPARRGGHGIPRSPRQASRPRRPAIPTPLPLGVAASRCHAPGGVPFNP